MYKKRIPISVIFTTYNEEHTIAEAIQSVYDWADEVIVVDSYSTDNTAAIITQFQHVLFVQREYYGPAFQKNWAIPTAKNKWVLLMDADERTTPEMRSEIEEILRGQLDFQTRLYKDITSTSNTASDSDKHDLLALHSYQQEQSIDGYWIGFTHYFMGKKVHYSGWQNDKTIRLINRDVCRYNNNRVHEEIITEGLSIGFLKNKFEHYTFKDLNHFIEKQKRYALWSAEDKNHSTGKITYFHLIFKPFARFFKHFILKKGFLDGYVGFMISAIAAWSVFMRYAFMLEKRGQSSTPHRTIQSTKNKEQV